jgi:hypothetical protein
MARLSLWKDGRHTNDFKFIDRRISEMFTMGGTGILLNKYLGPIAQGVQTATSATQIAVNAPLVFSNTTGINKGDFANGPGIPANTSVTTMTSTSVTLSANVAAVIGTGVNIGFSNDATQPSYANQSEKNIQDLLWLENRDRKYDTSVYKMRGIYHRADQDFDLSQFGLFLQTGTIFMVFHLRDMVDMIGRKLMSGDVLEFQHLKDYDGMDADLPTALKRYYVVSDTNYAAEGFSVTWWPHLWRVKLNPLVDSQEYKDILTNVKAGLGSSATVGQILSTYGEYLNINQAIVAQAEVNVPESGYNVADFYTLPTTEDGRIARPSSVTVDTIAIHADNTVNTADNGNASPLSKIEGYLTGNGLAPNGLPTGTGVAFPTNSQVGDYFLRLDYLPNRLFRYNGTFWAKIEDAVRTNLTPGATNNLTQRSGYVNTTSTYVDGEGNTHTTLQPLSRALTPKADNNI